MVPTAFDEENVVLDSPVSIPGVVPLSAWVGEAEEGQHLVISCWKPSREELEEIQRTGRVWLTVLGSMMPPVHLGSESPFTE